ncbi:MAG: DMT family transporter [Peptoniphilaceae bacterium]|uniref:DMT family transporter n=1 Tax=Parvimonas sp. TaxID=1944660 RepID=UPI002A7557F4|nr:DMT family transporter [Parvimonas sp.]MDD7765409.1 DMT family transporter [Peptoniphilaceae bacterium]MDY3050675.1 DMT family transporter [Parvimonas sp.]
MSFIKGIIFTIISAFVFGFTPILAKFTYDGGNNAVTLTFLRALLGIPFLYFGMKKNKTTMKITKREFLHFIGLSFLGIGITTTALYASYSYISVGMATTLHFIYPCVVYFICILFFREKITLKKMLALVFSMIGIVMLVDEIRGGSALGVFLATLSGITYGLFLVYLDKSGFKHMDPFKCTLYISLFNIVGLFVFGKFTGELTFALTPLAWGLTILISFLTAIFGNAFLQLGVKYCGATTASILCTFEPITSVVLGIIFLSESITVFKLVGCGLIVLAVLLLSINNSVKRKKRT